MCRTAHLQPQYLAEYEQDGTLAAGSRKGRMSAEADREV